MSYSIATEGYKEANKNYSIFYKMPIIELRNRVPVSYGIFASSESDFHKDNMPEIIKLHGSINWLTDNNNVYSEIGTEDEYLRLGLENFIIPPTLDKTKLYDTALLKILWKKAFDKLLEAKRIYICGFSFPVTDLSIRYLFQSALNNNKNNSTIYVINTQEALEPNSEYYLKQRYDEIFQGYNLNYDYCCNNSLEKFIQEIINPQLNNIEE